MAELNLYIKDLHDGRVFKYGEDCHDALQVWDGELRYSNLQNGDGSPYGYCFCNEDGSTDWLGEGAEYDEKYVHIGHVPVMQWISVKDRLPEHDERVLACYSFNTSMQFTQVLDYYATDPVPHFQHELGTDGMKVTHWMPLPPMPEENEQ